MFFVLGVRTVHPRSMTHTFLNDEVKQLFPLVLTFACTVIFLDAVASAKVAKHRPGSR